MAKAEDPFQEKASELAKDIPSSGSVLKRITEAPKAYWKAGGVVKAQAEGEHASRDAGWAYEKQKQQSDQSAGDQAPAGPEARPSS